MSTACGASVAPALTLTSELNVGKPSGQNLFVKGLNLPCWATGSH